MDRSFGVCCAVGMGRECYLSLFWTLTMARTLARMTALKGSGRLGQAFTMSAKSGEMAWFTVPRSCGNAVFGADSSVCSPPLGSTRCGPVRSQRVAGCSRVPQQCVFFFLIPLTLRPIARLCVQLLCRILCRAAGFARYSPAKTATTDPWYVCVDATPGSADLRYFYGTHIFASRSLATLMTSCTSSKRYRSVVSVFM